MNYCPKDGQICCDDCCRASGVCMRTGDDMMEKCEYCGSLVYDRYCRCEDAEEERASAAEMQMDDDEAGAP